VLFSSFTPPIATPEFAIGIPAILLAIDHLMHGEEIFVDFVAGSAADIDVLEDINGIIVLSLSDLVSKHFRVNLFSLSQFMFVFIYITHNRTRVSEVLS